MTKLPLPPYILAMAQQLAKHVDQHIKPHSCVFGATKGGSGFHYMVVSAGTPCKKRNRQKLIAWAGIYKLGRSTDNPRRPCLSVYIPRDLLANDPIVRSLNCPSGGSFGDSSRQECQGVTYAPDDQGYGILMNALTIAAKNWLQHC